MLETYLEVLDKKEQDIHKVKGYLQEGTLPSLLKIFFEKSSNRGNLYYYLENTQEILKVIVDKLQDEVLVGDFYLDRERSVSNSSSLVLKHPSFYNSFAYISLNSKSVYHISSYKKRIFDTYKNMSYLEKEIERLNNLIPGYDAEIEEWKNSSKIKLKMKRVKEENIPQAEKYVKGLKRQLKENKESLQRNLEQVQELEIYQESFYEELEQLFDSLSKVGFEVECRELEEEKTYNIFYNTQNNYHFSGETSYSEKNICILNDKEYSKEDLEDDERSHIIQKHSYNEEQMKDKVKVITDTKLFKNVSLKDLNESLSIHIEHQDGEFVLSADGTLIIKGKYLSLFDLIFYKEIRDVFYKELEDVN